MAEQYDIDKMFREAQENRAAAPPEEAWSRINETLDVDTTWSRLNKTLDAAYAARRRKLVLVYSLGALFAVSLAGWFISRTGKNTELVYENHQDLKRLPVKGITKQTIPVANAAANNNNGTQPVKQSNTIIASAPQTNNNIPNTNNRRRGTVPQQNAVAQNSGNGTDGTPVATNPNDGSNTTVNTTLNASSSSNENNWISAQLLAIAEIPAGTSANDFLEPGAADSSWYNMRFKRRFSITLFGGGRYNQMQNIATTTPDSIKATMAYAANASGVTRESLRPVGGIGFGYELTPRVQLHSSVYLFAGGGVDYTNYEGGRAVSHQLRLQYSSLTVGSAFRLCPRRMLINRRFYGTFNTGFSVSYLWEKTDKSFFYEIQQEQIAYRNIDAGVYAGYQYHIGLGKRLQLTPAVQWNQGLLNVSRNDPAAMAVARRIYNASAEARLGLKYTF